MGSIGTVQIEDLGEEDDSAFLEGEGGNGLSCIEDEARSCL
jgi:hypothetical protein